MKNQKSNVKKKNILFMNLNNKKFLMGVIGIIAVIALVFVGYKVFNPKEDMAVKGTKISTADLAKFPAKLTNVRQGTIYPGVNVSPHFPYKYATASDGKTYATFCSAFTKTIPAGRTCTLMSGSTQWGAVASKGVGAIISHDYVKGASSSNLDAYYVGELAINRYLCLLNHSDNASVCNTYNPSGAVQSFNYNGLSQSYKNRIDELVKVANNASKVTDKLTVSLSPNKLTFTKSGNYYVSNNIKVEGSDIKTWSVTSTIGTVTKDNSKKTFSIKIPVSSVKAGSSIKATATVVANKNYKIAAKYDCGDTYQILTPLLTVDKTISSSLKVSTNITNPQISVGKVDATTNKYVAGAKLLLTGPNNYKKEITTTSNLTVISSGLEFGEYTLKEVSAPKGYISSSEVKKVKLSASSLSATLTIKNYPTGITVSKRATDVNGEIQGATLRIVDDKGNVKYGPWTTTTSKKVISGLDAGTYYLEEVSAPSGYKKSNAKIKFTINSDGTVSTDSGKVDEIVFTNDPIKATFSKTDVANSKELPGAKLQILNSSGKVLYEWISTNTPRVISKLPAGKYFLIETQEPKGYVKKSEKLGFEIDEYGNITVGGKKISKVVMTNEKTKVKISKQDVTNGKEIPGAELEVKDASGKVIDKWKSTKKPHMIEGLSTGKYYLTERVAPKGYVVSEEKIEFIIKNDGTVDTVVMLNTPKVNVPNTASTASIVASIIGVVAVLFGGWMIYINVKSKKA